MSEIALAKSARLVSDDVEVGPPAPGRRRFAIAIAVSALVHAVVMVAVLLLWRPPNVTKPVVVLPVSLVYRPGSSGSGDGTTAAPGPIAPEPAPAPEPPPVAEAPRPVPSPAPLARRKPAAKPRPAEQAAPARGGGSGEGATAGATGGGGGGGTGGAGPGGGGGTSASPAYGSNPQPPYPMTARRLGLEGTVILRVVVAADGRPTSVTVLQSSGHEVLDTSALETVRTRWRFVPAQRNGIPVEDSVQVPIRFRQTAG